MCVKKCTRSHIQTDYKCLIVLSAAKILVHIVSLCRFSYCQTIHRKGVNRVKHLFWVFISILCWRGESPLHLLALEGNLKVQTFIQILYMNESRWNRQKKQKKQQTGVVFSIVWSSCFWSTQTCTEPYYTVLGLDFKNIRIIKIYSCRHVPGIPSITSALRSKHVLTNLALYALGRRQTTLYSVGWLHYGSSPQMTIHWSQRGKSLEKRGHT